MFELLSVIVFVWLLIKAISLALKLTWGMAKIIAGILIVLALPMLIVFLLFVGGAILIIPVTFYPCAFPPFSVQPIAWLRIPTKRLYRPSSRISSLWFPR